MRRLCCDRVRYDVEADVRNKAGDAPGSYLSSLNRAELELIRYLRRAKDQLSAIL